jgi:mannose-6-phosphate isomerase
MSETTDMMVKPMVLPPNGVRRFYRGGPAIAALRGAPPPGPDAREPEDWVGSATEAFGEPGVGLSVLGDGRLLRDVVGDDPEAWLGAAHVARWGSDPALLVKLLDAGERLPVHVHPDGPFAREHLGTRFGKTEAWIVVGGSGVVHLGWREDVGLEQLQAWMSSQDAPAMLDALHPLELSVGDAVFVPAGVAHAIGEGLLIAELQEPSDMSVMLEWDGHGISGEAEATLNLGWPTALTCVETTARDATPLRGPSREGGDSASAATPPTARALPPAADAFFRADWLGDGAELAQGFAVLLVLEGAGSLEAADGSTLPVARGDNVVIPYAAGVSRLTGDGVRALACRPADPTEERA